MLAAGAVLYASWRAPLAAASVHPPLVRAHTTLTGPTLTGPAPASAAAVDMRARIESWLAGQADAPSVGEVAAMRARIRQLWPASQWPQADSMLAHELAYRRAIAAWRRQTPAASTASPLAPVLALQHQQALRQQYIGVESSTGDTPDDQQQILARYDLARQQIEQMQGLSADLKEQQIRSLRAQLPVALQARLAPQGG